MRFRQVDRKKDLPLPHLISLRSWFIVIGYSYSAGKGWKVEIVIDTLLTWGMTLRRTSQPPGKMVAFAAY